MTGRQVTFWQRNDDRRKIYAVVTGEGAEPEAHGPLTLDEIRVDRFVGELAQPGDRALAEHLQRHADEYHDLDDFYRFYGYPQEVIDWVEQTEINPPLGGAGGRDYVEVAERLRLLGQPLADDSWEESKAPGLDPEGNWAFHMGFFDNWATADLSGATRINVKSYRFKAWLSFHT